MALNAGEILTSAQAQEPIFDKLLPGQAIESFGVHALRPDPRKGDSVTSL